MREIKFMAYEKAYNVIREVVSINFADKTVVLKDDFFDDVRLLNFDDVNLMQYTGEKDKNGKEIYDGYILKLDRDELLKNLEPEDIPDDTLIQVVVFEDGAFTARSRGGRKWGSVGGMFEYGEIIGNIYKNPELLK